MRRDIKIDEIRTLIALVDSGSLASAATIVGRTESAVSLQLKRLEDSTGATLLEKKGRKLVLTDAGRVVLEHGRKLLAAQAELRNLASGSRPSAPVQTELPAQDQYLGLQFHKPMRVTVSSDGQFREMRPVSSFRDNLKGPILTLVYDYWAARSSRNEAVDFGALCQLATRHSCHYVLAIVGQQDDRSTVVFDAVDTLAGDLQSSCARRREVLSQSFQKASKLLLHAQRSLAPISWVGSCILDSYQTHCSPAIALPLRTDEGNAPLCLFACEVSTTEKYFLPSGAGQHEPTTELIQLSAEAYGDLPQCAFSKRGHFKANLDSRAA